MTLQMKLGAARQAPTCFNYRIPQVSSSQEAGSVRKVSGLHEPRLMLPQRCRLLRQLPQVPVPWTAAGSRNCCQLKLSTEDGSWGWALRQTYTGAQHTL